MDSKHQERQNQTRTKRYEEKRRNGIRLKDKELLKRIFPNRKKQSKQDNPPNKNGKTRMERYGASSEDGGTEQIESGETAIQVKKDNQHGGRLNKDRNQKGYRLKFKHLLLSVGIIFVLALIAYTIILYGGKLIVDENKLAITPPTTIETQDGEIIWYLYDQYRLPVDLERIPQHVQDAFVLTEDKRFYSHSGVDIRSIFRAIYKDILAGSKVEGASTITQQLAKNLFLSNDKSWMRKTKEMMIALYLEREFTKDEILEMYLNAIYFGQGQYGIEAAANKYFYKSVSELNIEEAALMAGIVNAPNGYSPIDHPEKALNRRNLVLERMFEGEAITEEQMKAAQQTDLNLNLSQRKFNPAYQAYVDMVIQEASKKYGITQEELQTNRYRIVTALNEDAQQIAYDQFQYDGYFPGENGVEGAFVMMEQRNGELVAAIGGRDYEFKGLNRATSQMKRQPGSVMKPIAVYGPALEKEEYSPYSVLPDEEREWDGSVVHNYNDQYDGSVSLYNALIQSKNTSAVWLLNEIGLDYADTYLKKMGIDINKKKDGLSTALGGLTHGLSLPQIAEAYRTFGSGGNWIESHTIKEIKNENGKIIAAANPRTEKVFSPQVAWTMTEMLQGVVNAGTATAGYYPYELAGKTGTTQNNQDAWFVGYTPQYVTALWMGYDQPKSLSGGSSYPTELTKTILSELGEQQQLVQDFTKPDDVQAMMEPIELPTITDLSSTFVFGGLKLLKGKLMWQGTNDARIVYQVYEVNQDGEEDKKIGEVTGETEFVIDEFLLFQKKSYYIVPYDPIGNNSGQKSNIVEISF